MLGKQYGNVYRFNRWVEIERYPDGFCIVWDDFVGYRRFTFYDAWTLAVKLASYNDNKVSNDIFPR